MDTSFSNITEDQLIAALKARDNQAFKLLYRNYSGAVYGVVLRILRQETLAHDVLQETFVKVWKKIHSYDASRGRFFTWLTGIARNAAIDVTRSAEYKKSALSDPLDNKVVEGRSGGTEINVDTIKLKEWVAKLRPDLCEIIELIYFRAFTHSEAAKELGIPLGTAKSRVRIAINQLRTLMQ